MLDEQTPGSVPTGSPDDLIQSGPSVDNPGGEPNQPVQQPTEPTQQPGDQKPGDNVSKAEYEEIKTQYEELEKKFGLQGNELGDLRDFYRSIEPILISLEKNPALVSALQNGEIDSKTVEAILSGKATVEDAQQITQARDQVIKEMGKKGFANANPEEIEKSILEKATSKFKQEMEENSKRILETIEQSNKRKEFREYTDNFISETEDFKDYAPGIAQWLEEHPLIDDIAVAYEAVKGNKLAAEKKAAEEKFIAEEQKKIAANAAGGPSQNAQIIEGKDAADQLIAPASSPNELF